MVAKYAENNDKETRMAAFRHFHRSLILLTLACLPILGGALLAQEVSVQKLLERGANEEAVQRAERERDNPESLYLAGQAFAKMDNGGKAVEQYGRLREIGDDSWKAIGESEAAALGGNLTAAMEAANRGVAANGDNPYAHYQVGAVASRQKDYQRAADAYARAIELKPDFAYAHYYAGLANQRLRQTAKVSQHLEAFLKLAPDAPERSGVVSILRTLRG
jgi:tetratricopeptide (TPR) repeat protein